MRDVRVSWALCLGGCPLSALSTYALSAPPCIVTAIDTSHYVCPTSNCAGCHTVRVRARCAVRGGGGGGGGVWCACCCNSRSRLLRVQGVVVCCVMRDACCMLRACSCSCSRVERVGVLLCVRVSVLSAARRCVLPTLPCPMPCALLPAACVLLPVPGLIHQYTCAGSKLAPWLLRVCLSNCLRFSIASLELALCSAHSRFYIPHPFSISCISHAATSYQLPATSCLPGSFVGCWRMIPQRSADSCISRPESTAHNTRHRRKALLAERSAKPSLSSWAHEDGLSGSTSLACLVNSRVRDRGHPFSCVSERER
jgi:hypothetical protein